MNAECETVRFGRSAEDGLGLRGDPTPEWRASSSHPVGADTFGDTTHNIVLSTSEGSGRGQELRACPTLDGDKAQASPFPPALSLNVRSSSLRCHGPLEPEQEAAVSARKVSWAPSLSHPAPALAGR